MQKYTNLVQDNAGNAIGGTTVTVYRAGTAVLATLYTSNGSGAKANPFTNDTNGTFEIYAANGAYDFVYVKSGYTFDATDTSNITLFDPNDVGTYQPESYGAVHNGSANDSPAINAAIVACGTAGGGVVQLAAATYAIADTIINTYNNVLLKGLGSGYSTSAAAGGDYVSASTVIIWTGSAGETMINMGPAVGGADKLHGGGIEGIFFEGSNLAAIGVKLRSVNNAKFDITVEECTTVGVEIGVESTVISTQFNTQSNLFNRIVVIQQLTTSGIGIRLGGTTGGNISLNYWGNLTLLHRDQVALDMGDSDGNFMAFVRIFRHPAGTAYGVKLRASSDVVLTTRENVFGLLQTDSGGLLSEGTATNTFPAIQNSCLFYSLGNGSPAPTIELGSTFYYQTNLGDWITDNLIVTQSTNTAAAAIGDVTFQAYNSTPARVTYAFLRTILGTNTAGSETGTVRIVTKQVGTDTIQCLIGGTVGGWSIGSAPTGGNLGVGSMNAQAFYYYNGSALTGLETITYSASMTPNQRLGASHNITITNGTAFTINNPTNSVTGDIVTITLRNTSGGAHGAITWGANYKMAGALAAIATANSKTVQFKYDGTNWVEMNRSAADVAN